MEEVFEDEYLTYLYILKIPVNFKLTVCEKLTQLPGICHNLEHFLIQNETQATLQLRPP